MPRSRFKNGEFKYRRGGGLQIDGDLVVTGTLTSDGGQVEINEPFTFSDLLTLENNLVVEGDAEVQGALTAPDITGAVALDDTLDVAGAVVLAATLEVTGAATFTLGAQDAAVARTATVDGTTTGTIAAGTAFVAVTSADPAHIIKLPAAVVGNKIRLRVGANGCVVETPAASGATINGVDADGTNSLTLSANSYVEFACVAANTWIAFGYDADGVALTLLPA